METEWTKEQSEIIDKMIKESEDIGYMIGRDDSMKELINELEELVRKLKFKIVNN